MALTYVGSWAGIAGLVLYHYLTSKQAFFAAIAEEEGGEVLSASTPDAAPSPFDQITAGLDVYIERAESFPGGYRVAQRPWSPTAI